MNTYPILFTTQLRQHLRALRKKRGLTQAQLGALIGVSQARIAEIEANPGLVSFDQLMQLFSAFDVRLSLIEGIDEVQQEPPPATPKLALYSVQESAAPHLFSSPYIESDKGNADIDIPKPVIPLKDKKGSW